MNATRLLVLSTLFALTGCFSLAREEPPQRHYVLGSSLLPEMRPGGESLEGLRLGLRRLQLAEYLETPRIVVRHGDHQVRFSDFHRWGEDLEKGINRAVAGYLAARAPLRGVDVVPWPPQSRHDYLIQLHLLRFEGLAPEEATATQGEVHLLARWEIIRQQGGEVLARGTTDYRAPGWTVGDYEELVTLLDTGLRELTDDLVASLEALVST